MNEKTKPCPFCGSEWTQVRWIGFAHVSNGAFQAGYRGECTNCGATTRAHMIAEEAIETWNWRVNEELQQYRQIGTPEECREAMEKQQAKKPWVSSDGYWDGVPVYDIYECPECGALIEDWEEEPHHCICGQALKWEE